MSWRNAFDESLEDEQKNERLTLTSAEQATAVQAHLQTVVTLQAVVGPHYDVALPPLPAVIEEKDALLVEDLALLRRPLKNVEERRIM